MANTVAGILLTGLLAARPAAGTVTAGTLYSATDTALVYQSNGSAWATWASLGADNEVSAGALVNAGTFGSEHFAGSALPTGWVLNGTAPTSALVGSSVLSVDATGVGSQYVKPWTPGAVAFRLEARVQLGNVKSGGIVVKDVSATDTVVGLVWLDGTGNVTLYGAGFVAAGAALALGLAQGTWLYLALARTAAGVYTAFASFDRVLWMAVGTNFTDVTAITKAGFRINTGKASFDFLDQVV